MENFTDVLTILYVDTLTMPIRKKGPIVVLAEAIVVGNGIRKTSYFCAFKGLSAGHCPMYLTLCPSFRSMYCSIATSNMV